MRILVTGGIGFVGSHAIDALLANGHEVRLLVRSPERVGAARARFGERAVSPVVGDVADPGAVGRAMRGCDAVLHAASLYSLSARDAAAMREVNVPGTIAVLDQAARLGLDPIVYVSTTVAFLPGTSGTATEDSPVGEPPLPYARSKAAAEREARRRQARGDPVAIVYPGAVYGPGDPHLGEQALLVRNLLARRLPVLPGGGFHAVTIADTARTIAALFEPGRGPRRYIVPGQHLTVPQLASMLSELTGRPLPHLTVPARALWPAARAADLAQRLIPARLPVSGEAVYITSCDLRCDDSRARRELGIAPRPLREAVAELVRWLSERKEIRPRTAGALGGDPAPAARSAG